MSNESPKQPERDPNLSEIKSITEKAQQLPDNWQKILSRYSAIWIWSIIVGLNSTLFLSYFNYRPQNLGMATVAIFTIDIMSFSVSMMSWQHLYKVLRSFILPVVFGQTLHEDKPLISEHLPNEVERPWEDKSAWDLHYQQYSFSRSFYYMVFAIALKFFALFAEGIFNALIK